MGRPLAHRLAAALPALLLLLLSKVSAQSGPHYAAMNHFAVHNARLLLVTGATLSLNVTTPIKSGDWVTVSWSLPAGVVPSASDIVAYYSPSTADVTFTAPVKFQNATGAAQGQLSFRLLNQRRDGVFVYYTGGLVSPMGVARSVPVTFANPNEPTSIHLALTGVAGKMAVTWTSWNSSSYMPGPTVRWKAGTQAAWSSAAASTRTYTVQDMSAYDPRGQLSIAAGKGWMDPGQLHTGVMTSLPPATQVVYQVGSDQTGWSAVWNFTTGPGLGQPTRVAVTADMGQAEVDGSNIIHGNPVSAQFSRRSYFSMQPSINTSNRLAAMVATGDASLVLHNGDLSYAMGYGALWDVYGERTQGAAARAPWMVAQGNHESNWVGNPHSGRFNVTNTDSGGECGVPTSMRYPMPPPATTADSPWHSYDYGSIHFTTMSTEHPFHMGSPQYQFLAADLAAAAAARDAATVTGQNSDKPRWIVFSGHRPFVISSPYNNGPASDTPVAVEMQQALGPLWDMYGVDLTLSGHHHSYQRSQPLAIDVPQAPCSNGAQAGTIHIVLGNGGAGFSTCGGGPQDSLIALSNGVNGTAGRANHGYGRIIATATTLQFVAFASDLPAGNASVMDAITLTKPPGPRACFSSGAAAGPAQAPQAAAAPAVAPAAAPAAGNATNSDANGLAAKGAAVGGLVVGVLLTMCLVGGLGFGIMRFYQRRKENATPKPFLGESDFSAAELDEGMERPLVLQVAAPPPPPPPPSAF